MEKLFFYGAILAGCGVALVLGQLIWTVVLNCRILDDLAQKRQPRYDYEVKPSKGLTDMTVFCRFIRDDDHPLMYEIVYRKLMWGEFIIRHLGLTAEMTGMIAMAVAYFHPTVMVVFPAALVSLGMAYLVNFIMAYIVSIFAYWPYQKRIR